MKKKSLVMMVISLALVGTIMVGATLAYFTDKTEAVTNTFTVGANVDIDLFENVNQNDSIKQGYITASGSNLERVPAGVGSGAAFNRMYPGLKLIKAPFVEKTATSSDCYVIVKVKGIDNLNKAGFEVSTIDATKWTRVGGDPGSIVDGTYRYETKLTGTDKTPNLFDTVTFKSSSNSVSVNAITPAEFAKGIEIKAYAMQADGFVTDVNGTAAYHAFATSEGAALLAN